MKVQIEIEGSPNFCTAAVAMASAWSDGSMLAFVEQLRFFGEWAADRIDEDYDMPCEADIRDALIGVERLREQLELELRRVQGEEPYPTSITLAEVINAQ